MAAVPLHAKPPLTPVTALRSLPGMIRMGKKWKLKSHIGKATLPLLYGFYPKDDRYPPLHRRGLRAA